MNLMEALAQAITNDSPAATGECAPAKALSAFDPLVCNRALAGLANEKAGLLARLADKEIFALRAQVARANEIAKALDVLAAPLHDHVVVEQAKRAKSALGALDDKAFNELTKAVSAKKKVAKK